MKKLILSAGLLSFLWSNALKAQQSPKESSAIIKQDNSVRKLKFEEINFVGSYYTQDGDNAAVTGGIGTEELDNVGVGLNVKFSMLDKQNRKNTFSLDANVDAYSSASSDQIDPSTVSSASSSDVHFYPSLTWTRMNDETGNNIGLNLSYSTEYDYTSVGGGIIYSKTSKDKNSEFSTKFNVFFDKWKVILPVELRGAYPSGSEGDSDGIDYKPRNSYNLSLGYSKVINSDLQLMFMFDPSYQEGLLSTPFHRVYFNDGSKTVEKLSGKRIKFPASVRANYFANDYLILRSFYRFYSDDWGLTAHTASLETVLKLNPFFSISPHYRFNAQSGIDYFSPFQENDSASEFYSSDYDLSKFTSHFVGIGFRVATPGGVMGIKGLNSLELRYGFYSRSTGLDAHIVSLAVQIK